MSTEGICLSILESEVDVEFRTQEESSVEPPNPNYLRVHVTFDKVQYLSGRGVLVECLLGC